VRCAGAKWHREVVEDVTSAHRAGEGGDAEAARRLDSFVIQSLGLVVLWVAGDVVLWDYRRGGGLHSC
jgi:hypothetical protein